MAAVPRQAALNCGKCHRPLFTGHPLELSAADLQRHPGAGRFLGSLVCPLSHDGAAVCRGGADIARWVEGCI